MKRYVGITGFVNRAEVDACLDALPEGLTLMCGVLVSAKSLAGVKNKWHRRYPAPEEIAGIFSPDPRCLNLIHYCSDTPPPWDTIRDLARLGGCGFQFNGAYPEPDTLLRIVDKMIVLQVRPGKTTPDAFRAAVSGTWNCETHALIDGSGGMGREADPRTLAAWATTISGYFGSDIGLGFAGGLDADSLPRIAHEVRTWGASIDAEGRLRDGDEGGTLNLDKARAYLRAAGEIMAPTAQEQGR